MANSGRECALLPRTGGFRQIFHVYEPRHGAVSDAGVNSLHPSDDVEHSSRPAHAALRCELLSGVFRVWLLWLMALLQAFALPG
jgi:hypothetical protein